MSQILESWEKWEHALQEKDKEIEKLRVKNAKQEKLIDYLERYGPKPLNERLEQAEAKIEELKANSNQFAFEAGEVTGKIIQLYEERLKKVVEAITAMRAAHHEGSREQWEEAVRTALAAVQSKEES